jgi:hypothetical protein
MELRDEMELQDEAAWLRNRIARMRLAFRFATEPQVESILRELIADAEDRLVGASAVATLKRRTMGEQWKVTSCAM